MPMMKAVVIHEPGGPDVLKIENIPVPTAKPGEVLIRVKAFGLNRSELFTRQGHSPNVKFPRVLGIEAVGIVASAPGREFQQGDVGGNRDGRTGPRLRWGLRRVHLHPCQATSSHSDELGLDDSRSHARDVGDSVGLALPLFTFAKRRDASCPWRNHLRWPRGGCDSEELWSARGLDNPKP